MKSKSPEITLEPVEESPAYDVIACYTDENGQRVVIIRDKSGVPA